MKKHRLENFFRSVFRNHIDAENSESLPTKEDVDKNVEKILKILHADEDDGIASENLNKSELASLIDDFHKGYQEMHGRYYNLMGKFKNKIRSKENNGSFSIDFTSSSDSESSDELEKKDKRKNNHVSLETYQTLVNQLETVKNINIDLEKKLEKEQILSAEIADKANKELDHFRKEIGTLQSENSGLSNRITTLSEEKESLRKGNFSFLKRIQEGEKALAVLKDQIENLKSTNAALLSDKEHLEIKTEASEQEIHSLRKAIENLTVESGILKDENSKLLSSIDNLKQELEVKIVENDAAISGKLEAFEKTALLSEEVEILKTKNSEILVEYENMKQELENVINDVKAEGERQLLTISQLQIINDELKKDATIADEEKKKLASEILTLTMKLEEDEIIVKELRNVNSQLTSSISNLQTELEASNLQLSDLNKTLINIEEEKKASALEHSIALSRLEEAETRIENLKSTNAALLSDKEHLEIKTEAKEQEIHSLQKAIESLTVESGILKDENSKLLSSVDNLKQELEVKIVENDAAVSGKLEAFEKIALLSEEVEILKTKNSEILVEYENMKQELENVINDIKAEGERQLLTISQLQIINDELKNDATMADEEKKKMASEISALTMKLEEDEIIVKELQNVNSQSTSSISNLQTELEVSNLQLSDLNKTLINIEEEKKASALECSIALSRLEEAETHIRKLENDALEMINENLFLSQNLDKLQSEVEQARDDNDQLQTKIKELSLELEATKAAAVEDKVSFNSELETKNNVQQELVLNMQKLESELEILKQEILVFENNLSETSSEKRSLEEKLGEKEKETVEAKSELEQLTTEVQTLRADLDKLKQERLILENDNNDLQHIKIELERKLDEKENEMERLKLNFKQLEEKLDLTVAENTLLSSDIAAVKSELQSSMLNTQRLEDELEMLKQENLMISVINSEKLSLKEKLGEKEEEIVNTRSVFEQLTAELRTLRDELDKFKQESLVLENDKHNLLRMKNELEGKLEDKEKEIESLQLNIKKLEEKLNLTDAENTMLSSDILMMKDQMQNSDLHVQRLEGEVEKLQEVIVALEANKNDLQCQEIELEGKLVEKETEVERLQECSKELMEKLELVEAEKVTLNSEILSLKNELQTVELELGNMKQEYSILESSQSETISLKIALEEKLLKKEKEMCQLEENYREIQEKLDHAEAEKEHEAKENAKLTSIIQNLEVQLRLSNQKLKITETENKASIEGVKRAIEEMNAERKEIEEQMLKLSSMKNFLESNVEQLKEVVEVGLSALANRYHQLENIFREKISRILIQLSVSNEEMTLFKRSYTELKAEGQDLLIKLKHKDEIIATLKAELNKTSSKFVEKEKESVIMREKLTEYEVRTRNLEESLKEKIMEISEKDEEKREAIRQLCLHVEYHREICDHLCKYISAVVKRSGRS